jgi:hypothetical protein
MIIRPWRISASGLVRAARRQCPAVVTNRCGGPASPEFPVIVQRLYGYVRPDSDRAHTAGVMFIGWVIETWELGYPMAASVLSDADTIRPLMRPQQWA